MSIRTPKGKAILNPVEGPDERQQMVPERMWQGRGRRENKHKDRSQEGAPPTKKG